ncbi:hypothetical protein ISN73_03010 [Dyella acidisoli]
MTVKRILFGLAPYLLLVVASSAHAGWYQVRNYAGTIGSLPVHVSLQTYDVLDHNQPNQYHADGSYYYDAHRIPIPLQGHLNPDGKMVLCEALEPTSFAEGPHVPARSPQHPQPCPITLTITDNGATGEWNDGKKSLPIALNQVGRLDDTVSNGPLLEGVVEIPMWHHAKNHMLLGVYRRSKNCPVSMVDLRLVNIASGKIDNTLTFDDCSGTVATSIYTNVYRADDPGHVTVIAPGGYHGMGEDKDVVIEP